MEANRRLSRRLYCCFPQGRDPDIWDSYVQAIAGLLQSGQVRLVLDVGGGRVCRFAPALAGWKGRVIALDLSWSDLSQNRQVQGRIVGDAAKGLPLAAASVDLVCTHSVLEHLADSAAFFSQAARVLRPGGYMVNLLPCKFAPFALLNQLLPQRASRALLDRLTAHPEELGHRHFYDRCFPSALRRLLEQNGLELVELRLGYAQSDYYSFFLPLFLLSAAYEGLVRLLGSQSLCAYILMVARKPLEEGRAAALPDRPPHATLGRSRPGGAAQRGEKEA